MDPTRNSSAASCTDETYDTSLAKAFVAILVVVICSVNAMFAIANVKFNKNMSTLGMLTTTAFLLNGAVPWSLRLLIIILREAFTSVDAYFCTVLGILYGVSMHAQACLMSAVAHDRAQIITQPLSYHEQFFQRRPLVLLLICIVAPSIIILSTVSTREAYCVDVLLGCIVGPNYVSVWSVICLAGLVALQLSCAAWYSASYIVIWRTVKTVTQNAESSSRSGCRAALRTFAILGAQHIVFVLVPNVFATIVFSYANLDENARLSLFIAMAVFYAGNDFVAPAVYVCFDRGSRDSFRRLIHCQVAVSQS